MANEKLGVATELSPEIFYNIRELYSTFVPWGLTFLKFEQTSLFYSHSVSYFNLGGGIGALSRRD